LAHSDIGAPLKLDPFRRREGYLFSSVADVICLGGGSLPILFALLALPAEEYKLSALFA